MTESPVIRGGTLDDIPAILTLQRSFLYDALPLAERAHGFLSVPFTVAQLHAMVAGDALMVAEFDDMVVGYYALAGAAGDPAMVHYLEPAIAAGKFSGTMLNQFRLGLSPQMCVDRRAQGLGIATRLHFAIASHLAARYELLLGSVHRANLAGYAFNVEHLGAQVVFEDATRRFIAFDLQSPTHTRHKSIE